MNDVAALTLAYLQNHPHDAAKVLETLPAETVASFLAQVPVRIGVPAIASLPSQVLAALLPHLGDDLRDQLLHDLGPQAAARIMRHVPRGDSQKLLETLPTHYAWQIKGLLHYPEGSIGAAMDPDVLVASTNQNVVEVLEAVQRSHIEHLADVYIMDSRQHYMGAVALSRLLKASPKMLVNQLSLTQTPSLSTRATLASVADHAGWINFNALPVLDRDNHIVGVLRHTELVNKDTRDDDANPGMGYLLGDMLDIYWLGWLSTLDVVFGGKENDCGDG